MEAPNKIYVQQIGEVTFNALWKEKPFDKGYSLVYIRKDTLLEWAKAEIELSKTVECVSEKSYEEGRQQVAQNLINKIESL